MAVESVIGIGEVDEYGGVNLYGSAVALEEVKTGLVFYLRLVF